MKTAKLFLLFALLLIFGGAVTVQTQKIPRTVADYYMILPNKHPAILDITKPAAGNRNARPEIRLFET